VHFELHHATGNLGLRDVFGFFIFYANLFFSREDGQGKNLKLFHFGTAIFLPFSFKFAL